MPGTHYTNQPSYSTVRSSPTLIVSLAAFGPLRRRVEPAASGNPSKTRPNPTIFANAIFLMMQHQPLATLAL